MSKDTELVKKLWDLREAKVITVEEMRKIHKRILKKVI
jgi:hypothetical protein